MIYLGKNPSSDDSLWMNEITPQEDQIFWSKTDVEILVEPENLKQYGIILNQHGEYEAFWDGELIYKNGDPTNSLHSDKKGKMISAFIIPKNLLTKGKHQINHQKKHSLSP